MLEFTGSIFAFIIGFIVIINVIAIYIGIGMCCLVALWFFLVIVSLFRIKTHHSGPGTDLGFGDTHDSSCGEDCPECMGVGVVGDDGTACPTCGGEGEI